MIPFILVGFWTITTIVLLDAGVNEFTQAMLIPAFIIALIYLIGLRR